MSNNEERVNDTKVYDIVVLVSNDLTHDRRMHRTCKTLSDQGWNVLLIGREVGESAALSLLPYDQYRIRCTFNKGPLFYAELVIRLSSKLKRVDYKSVLFVDEDTLGVIKLISKKDRKYYFDAHELFTEVPELSKSTLKRKIWDKIGRTCLPKIDKAYTVNLEIANELKVKYVKHFEVIHNVPSLLPITSDKPNCHKQQLSLVYLGMLNPGRGVAEAIEAVLLEEDYNMIIIGDGPLREELASKAGDCDRIIFKGMISGDQIHEILMSADIGLNLLDISSRSYYLSLANKFFDYSNAGLPSICMDTPTYNRIGGKHNATFFIKQLSTSKLQACLQAIKADREMLEKMRAGVLEIRKQYNWAVEKKRLLTIYDL